MRLPTSVAVALGIVALGLGLAACAEADEPTSFAPIESTAAPGSTTFEAAGADYHVVLKVDYRQTLRYPGSGHLPRELDVTHQIDQSAAAGESVEAEARGHVDWTIRCFIGDTIADPEAAPASQEREVHPFAPASTLDLLPDQAEREPDVDWLAGPGIVVLEAGDELWIAHRLR